MHTTDLFLRTYPGDYKWLRFLFKSICRHLSGFRRLVVVHPIGADHPPVPVALDLCRGGVLPVEVRICRAYKNDYVGQQITKMRAWKYTDADDVCYLDSDLVFIRDFSPATYWPMVEGRRWAEVGDARCWLGPTRELLGAEPPFETMARHPFCYPRGLIEACYVGVGGEGALIRYSTGQAFSEFNLLGNWAILREGFQASAVNVSERPDVVKQFWSHGGITLEVEDELRRLGHWED